MALILAAAAQALAWLTGGPLETILSEEIVTVNPEPAAAAASPSEEKSDPTGEEKAASQVCEPSLDSASADQASSRASVASQRAPRRSSVFTPVLSRTSVGWTRRASEADAGEARLSQAYMHSFDGDLDSDDDALASASFSVDVTKFSEHRIVSALNPEVRVLLLESVCSVVFFFRVLFQIGSKFSTPTSAHQALPLRTHTPRSTFQASLFMFACFCARGSGHTTEFFSCHSSCRL
jgi:hypothetical protein